MSLDYVYKFFKSEDRDSARAELLKYYKSKDYLFNNLNFRDIVRSSHKNIDLLLFYNEYYFNHK